MFSPGATFERLKTWWGDDKRYLRGLYNFDRIHLPVIPEERELDYFRYWRVVLFCDDEHLIRQLGKRILEREGYEVVLAGTGEEALQILERAELFDSTDINLYILKTDAYLAMDRQDQAVELLEQSLHQFDGEEKIELLFELADV